MIPPEVLVYGTVALDRFRRVTRTGEALPEDTWEEKPGGEALNTALALWGWGVSVALVGTATGSDLEGNRLRALLKAEGISADWIPLDAHAVTPCCEIHVFPDGERHMSGRGFAQAIAPPVPTELLTHKPLIAVDPNLGQNARDLALSAAELGCTIVAMDFAHDPEVVRVARVLQISQESLRRFGGPSGNSEEVVASLQRQGAQTVVLTQGAQGGIVASPEGISRFSAYTGRVAVDTTGAGDTFRAGLCFGLVRGWEWTRTLRFASAAAACHCQRLGGGSKVPLAEVLGLLAEKK